MIRAFPDPYPDELLYSVCARYSDRVQYPSRRALSRDLFGRERCARVGLPGCLGSLIARLPSQCNYTVTDIIDNHTLFPFYEPFLPPGRSSRLRHAMEVDEDKSILTLMGIQNNVILKGCIRFCSHCIKEDKEQFGECYWHRVHQIPGVEVCPIHTSSLQICSLLQSQVNRYEYLSAEKMVQRTASSLASASPVSNEKFGKIACEALWLLQNHDMSTDLSVIQKKYLMLLADGGLATYNGRVFTSKLQKQFQDYYGRDFLKSTNCELKESRTDSWLLYLPHEASRVSAPVRHLLVIHFLGHTVETFLKLPEDKQPFGTGPWPCLNPVCEQYHQRCIQHCEVHASGPARDGHPRGIFSCSCGFTYSRIGPDHKPEDHFRASSIKAYGLTWETKLRELWKNPFIGVRGVARALKTDRDVILVQVQKLGLPFPFSKTRLLQAPSSERDSNTETATWSELRDDNRILWLNLRKDYPYDGIRQLEEKFPGVYQWLYRHDREWLLTHSKKKQPKPPQGRQVNWEMRDEQFVIEARAVALQIKNAPGRPAQLTFTLITKNMSQGYLIHKSRARLPNTVKTISEFVEPDESYWLRRVQWLQQCCQQEKCCPTRTEFVRRGYLGAAMARWVSVKEAIDEALNTLHRTIP